jgi:hypothetical protein
MGEGRKGGGEGRQEVRGGKIEVSEVLKASLTRLRAPPTVLECCQEGNDGKEEERLSKPATHEESLSGLGRGCESNSGHVRTLGSLVGKYKARNE